MFTPGSSDPDVENLFSALFRLFKPENFVKTIVLWKGKETLFGFTISVFPLSPFDSFLPA